MKKSFLALAVAAVAAASVAQATTIYDKDGTSISMYGRVQSTYYSADSGNSPAQDYGDSGLATKARLAFDFRSTLTSWADAFAKAEWQAADGNKGEGNGLTGSDDFNARYLWLGVDFGQFGSVKFGKFEDAVKYTIATTDIFEDFGCVGQLGNDDRRNGQMMYEWSGYGVDVKASVQGAANNQQVDGAYFANEKLDIDSGFALAAGYTSPDVLFGPISVKAAYGYVQFQGDDSYIKDGSAAGTANNHGNVSGYDDYKQWAASISWGGATGFFTGLTYQQRDFSMFDNTTIKDRPITVVDDYKVQGTEFVVRYGWNNGVAIKAAYEWQNLDMDGANSPDLDAKVANLQLEWQMTPNFKIWTEARWDVDTDDGYDELTGSTHYEDNIYSVGARYNF